jgi:anti-sigma regulatory factor (Ser/Thr protein kinase)
MDSEETELIVATLARNKGCSAEARRILYERLGEKLDSAALGDVKLVATELINNAYLHGEGRIQLRVSRVGERLRVEVIDEGQGRSIQINEQPNDSGGRGLRIVDSLAMAWGAFEGTTHVWADLDL